MNEILPSLNGLRAFEAAARHMSMTRAADELAVTPSALSHQIRSLEDFLQVRLFERGTRKIALTAAGRRLQPGLEAGFTHIREAVAVLRAPSNPNVLVVSTPPGLTAKWLAPRLYRFSTRHPDIDVRITSSAERADFHNDGIDVAIRNMPLDPPGEPGLVFEPLVEITYLPVCTPGFLEARGPFDTVGQVAKVPLIHDDTFANKALLPRWRDWFAHAGAKVPDVARGLRFNSSDHALSAAAEGAGILLAQDIHAHDDLRSGRLVVAFDMPFRPGRAYNLVYPDHPANPETVAAFAEWVKEEVDKQA